MKEQESFQDDLEVEIIDLDKNSNRRSRHDAAHASAKPFSKLHFHRQTQLSPRQRLLRIAISLSIVVLAAIIIGNSVFLHAIGQYLPFYSTPKPVPTILPGTDFFYTNQSPSWGKLYLDGKLISNPPIMGRAAPMHLAPGRHQFLWRTEPFQPFRCTISVPIALDDTCPYQMAQQNEYGPTHPRIVPHSWNLLFYESMNALPIAQRIALMQSMQTALNTQQSVETVYPGERYLYAKTNHTLEGSTAHPLLATLRFQFDIGSSPGLFCTSDLLSCSRLLQLTGDRCQLYCQANQSVDLSHTWFVNVAINALWDYLTFDGRTVAQYYPAALSGSNVPSYELPLLITWQNGDWHTDVGFSYIMNDLGCLSADDALNRALPSTPNLSYLISFASGPVPAAGCLVAVTLQVDPATPSSSSSSSSSPPVAFYLYRFGVMLVANDQAHHMSPGLPLADIYERKLAQQLSQANGIQATQSGTQGFTTSWAWDSIQKDVNALPIFLPNKAL